MNLPEIPNLTDRELLVQQTVSLNQLCRSVSELKNDNEVGHADLFRKVDDIAASKISNKIFYFIIGIMITAQVAMVSYIGGLSTKVTTNIADIQHVEFKINKMLNNE